MAVKIHSILFKKKYWTTQEALRWCRKAGLKPKLYFLTQSRDLIIRFMTAKQIIRLKGHKLVKNKSITIYLGFT